MRSSDRAASRFIPERLRDSRARRWCFRTALAAGAALLPGLTPSQASAQWEYGWWFPAYQTPASVTFLNDQATARTQQILAQKPQALRVPSRTGRDTTFFERYDYQTRRSMEEGIARRRTPSRSQPAAPPPAAPVAVAREPRREVAALDTFFDNRKVLLWPKDAPFEGSLGSYRDASEAASLAVLDERRERGVARVSTVANARERLLEYGQPALDYLAEHTTNAIVDVVHDFLLRLYDSLGAAAFPDQPPPG